VAEVPSESHSYWVESSTSLPEFRPVPADAWEKMLLEADDVRIKKTRLLLALPEESEVILLRFK
jgi:hypothetical protein